MRNAHVSATRARVEQDRTGMSRPFAPPTSNAVPISSSHPRDLAAEHWKGAARVLVRLPGIEICKHKERGIRQTDREERGARSGGVDVWSVVALDGCG